MKRSLAATTAVAALVLSACGSDTPDTVAGDAPETVTVTVTETVTAPPEEPAPADETVESETTTEAAPTTAPEDTDFGDREVSDRGNLTKKVGQPGGIVDESTGATLVEFRLTDIETDFECNSRWAEKSENGQFLALTFEVETFKELADDEWVNTFSMSEYDFTIYDTDGTRENDSRGNAWMCLDDKDRLPSEIGPGEKATGRIVLDTAVREGFVAYSTYGVDGAQGWEWAFPQG